MPIARYVRSLFHDRPVGEIDGTLNDLAATNRWLATHGAGPIPKRPTASSDRPRQVFEIRPDLRAAFPHALLPPGRKAFFNWLFTHGKAEYALTNPEIIAFLVELGRDPTSGIECTYRLTPSWQKAVPAGLSASGWDTLIRWLRSTEEISGEWLDHAVQSNAGTHAGGLNLIGHFRLPCGVGEEIARFADGLEQLDIPISRRDVPTFQLTPPICGIRPLGLENHDITFLKFGATVDLRDAFERTGLYPRPGVYRVAGWSWELDTFPLEATRQLDFVDEIWTPSRFVADGAERIAAGRPVTIMPPAIPVPVIPSHARARFDLDPKAFVIFFAFDAGSVFERKNPFALIQAVRAAFRRDDRATLVLKVSNPTAAAGPMARLRTELNEIGGRLIEGMIPREDVAALLSACDCYASLHRSEGFGFSLAEAMLLGKPIVATGYSGNLDFMSSENSYLVSHRLIELESAVGPYAKGARWAEPNVDHAAELLRQVYEFPDDARQFGLNAKQELEPRFAPSTAARRIVQRLQTIRESRGRTAA